jgi:hypothetical protein
MDNKVMVRAQIVLFRQLNLTKNGSSTFKKMRNQSCIPHFGIGPLSNKGFLIPFFMEAESVLVERTSNIYVQDGLKNF